VSGPGQFVGLCCMFGPSVAAPSSLICRGDAVLLLIPPDVQRETNLFSNLASLPQFLKRRHATLCSIESRDRVADDNVVTDCATYITDSLKKSNSAWLSHPSGVWYNAVAELRTRRYGAGDVIVREGDGAAGNGWQMVVEGQVEMYKGKGPSSSSSATAAAESSHVSTLHPGESYGDSDLASNPAFFTHTLICSSSCTIASLSLSAYHLAVSKYTKAHSSRCIDIVSRMKPFAHLNAAAVAALHGLIAIKSFPAGQVVFKERERSQVLEHEKLTFVFVLEVKKQHASQGVYILVEGSAGLFKTVRKRTPHLKQCPAAADFCFCLLT
jgi:hypothetical protein